MQASVYIQIHKYTCITHRHVIQTHKYDNSHVTMTCMHVGMQLPCCLHWWHQGQGAVLLTLPLRTSCLHRQCRVSVTASQTSQHFQHMDTQSNFCIMPCCTLSKAADHADVTLSQLLPLSTHQPSGTLHIVQHTITTCMIKL
jgi:hypothetical protein